MMDIREWLNWASDASLSPLVVVLLLGAVVLIEILGLLSAYNALMSTRTSQGTIAWILALITWPIFAVPLYWIFGRSKLILNYQL